MLRKFHDVRSLNLSSGSIFSHGPTREEDREEQARRRATRLPRFRDRKFRNTDSDTEAVRAATVTGARGRLPTRTDGEAVRMRRDSEAEAKEAAAAHCGWREAERVRRDAASVRARVAFVESLRLYGQSLEELNLDDSKLYKENAAALLSELPVLCPRLRVLGLSNQGLYAPGMTALVAAIPRLPCLRALMLHNVHVEAAAVPALAAALERRTSTGIAARRLALAKLLQPRLMPGWFGALADRASPVLVDVTMRLTPAAVTLLDVSGNYLGETEVTLLRNAVGHMCDLTS